MVTERDSIGTAPGRSELLDEGSHPAVCSSAGWARLKCLIGDEAASKTMWAIKGAAGTLPCLMRWNVVQARSELHLPDSSGTLVPHTCFDMRKLRLRTDADLRAAARMLFSEKPARAKKSFETLEQFLGIDNNPAVCFSIQIVLSSGTGSIQNGDVIVFLVWLNH